jgi:hypothetical protein
MTSAKCHDRSVAPAPPETSVEASIINSSPRPQELTIEILASQNVDCRQRTAASRKSRRVTAPYK